MGVRQEAALYLSGHVDLVADQELVLEFQHENEQQDGNAPYPEIGVHTGPDQTQFGGADHGEQQGQQQQRPSQWRQAADEGLQQPRQQHERALQPVHGFQAPAPGVIQEEGIEVHHLAAQRPHQAGRAQILQHHAVHAETAVAVFTALRGLRVHVQARLGRPSIRCQPRRRCRLRTGGAWATMGG